MSLCNYTCPVALLACTCARNGGSCVSSPVVTGDTIIHSSEAPWGRAWHSRKEQVFSGSLWNRFLKKQNSNGLRLVCAFLLVPAIPP